MDRLHLAQARARGYALLGHFVAQGLRADTMTILQQVAEVAHALPEHYHAENAAAAHYAVFGRTVFGCESVFRGSAGQRGGDAAARVAAAYATCGFVPEDPDEADSLATELACLAWLCGAEADALEDGELASAHRAQSLQADFLGAHLLCWLPALCEALQRQPDRLYAATGALLWSTVADHALSLAPRMVALPSHAAHRARPAPDAAAAATRLGEIAEWLLAPAGAGFLLGRDTLHAMAAAVGAPIGFAERRTLLLELLRSAGASDTLPLLLRALDARAASAGATYAAMADEWPALAPWLRVWQERTAGTQGLLAAMGATAENAQAPE